MSRPLVITEEVEKALFTLRAYAERNPLTIPHCGPPPGDDPRYRCEIPIDYTVVFTHDRHPQGLFRHVSISVRSRDGLVVHPLALEMVCKRLGFEDPLKPDGYYIEHEDAPHPAVNIVERIV